MFNSVDMGENKAKQQQKIPKSKLFYQKIKPTALSKCMKSPTMYYNTLSFRYCSIW